MSASDERTQKAWAYQVALWLLRAACALGAIVGVILFAVRQLTLVLFILWLICLLLGASSIFFLYLSGVRAWLVTDRDHARRFYEKAFWRSRE